jgi:hypothetical protein
LTLYTIDCLKEHEYDPIIIINRYGFADFILHSLPICVVNILKLFLDELLWYFFKFVSFVRWSCNLLYKWVWVGVETAFDVDLVWSLLLKPMLYYTEQKILILKKKSYFKGNWIKLYNLLTCHTLSEIKY